MVAGVLTLGGRVFETSAKRIVRLSVGNGIAISGVSGVLVTLASLYGLPIPITQVATSAIAGVSAAKNGQAAWKQPIITIILRIWFVSPVLSMVVSYFLIQSFIKFNFYADAVIIGAAIATVCMVSLTGSRKQLFQRESETAGRKKRFANLYAITTEEQVKR
ncbi:hypothetical protein BpJC7_14410 [Weizmannia acidilactici]|uniref:Phosphate transporter n=1 Tax=Weizmannia acidilactici TaxID=2607726 RepID=A0A5J4JI71_9BACI|nr:inorganic phosphate transporter [Weizmannia acidilactici]GER70138.1 hypothetical protein BpJC7_14410 [Weizmannia acidilactici]